MKKTCKACLAAKEITEFYVHKAMGDGRLSFCKDCVKARVRKHRRLNDSVREYDRKRGSRMTVQKMREARLANPEAYKARTAVGNALRDGRLQKEPCLFCSSEEKIHGHHRDYAKPLDVIWLCARCHHRFHANFPETAAHEPKP